MSQQPLDVSLQQIKFLYRIAGLNIENRQKTRLETSIYIFHFLWIGTDIVFSLDWFLEGVSKGLHFIELTHVTPCLALGLMGEFKSFFYVLYEKNVHQLINSLLDLEKQRIQDHHAEKIVKDETRFLRVLVPVLIVVNAALLVLFNLGPLILIAVNYSRTGELELILPFLNVYPFDGYDLKYWPYVYLHQFWTSCIVLILLFAVDFLFYICCTHIRIQFKLLQKEVEDVIPDVGFVKGDPKLRERLCDLLKWHQAIISSADMLESIYSKSTLFNYLTSSVIICLTGFNVTALDDVTMAVTFASIFGVGMLQIFFICFFGHELMNSSTDVSLATYKSRWYIADASVGKTALMMQTRANKPCKLTAAGFADVNLRAFMKILSTAWSYFALLQTVYRSNQKN